MNEAVMNQESLADTANIVAEKPNDDQSITVNGKKVTLYKVKTRNLGTVLNLVNAAFKTLGIEKLGDLPKMDLENPTVLLQLIANMHAPTVSAAAELCSLDEEGVNDLEIDDLVKLVMRLVKINKVFFLERVLPILKSETENL